MSRRHRFRAALLTALAAVSLSCATPNRRAGSAPPPALPVLKIATQSPLSGDRAPFGRAIRNGVQLAVAEGAGPIEALGFRVEVAPFDDRARSEVGVANAERIVADPDILLVVGHLTSSVALPASDVYQRASLAMISPANSDPRLTGRGYNSVFRVVGRDDGQGEAAAEFAAAELRVEQVFLVHDGTPQGEAVAASFRRRAARVGLRVAGEKAGEREVGPILNALSVARVDLVYLSMTFHPAGVLIREARKRGVTAVFLGPDWLDSPQMLRVGPAVVGTFYTTVAGPPSFYSGVDAFVSAYRTRFAAEPPAFALQAYDAAALGLEALAGAIREAGGSPTRRQVAAQIRRIQGFRGLTGTFTFDARGDPTAAAYFVLKITSVNPLEWEQRQPVRTLRLPPPGP